MIVLDSSRGRLSTIPARATGLLLIVSLFTLLVAVLLLTVTGATGAFGAALGGRVAGWAPFAGVLRAVTFLFAAGWIAQFLGLLMLARLLEEMGDALWARLGLGLVSITAILGILEATFEAGMTPWAAIEAASTGQVPTVYAATHSWVSAFKWIYLVSGLIGQGAYGTALLRTRLLPPSIGGFGIAWTGLWLLALIVGVGAPAVLFIAPTVFGIALILQTSKSSQSEGGSDE